ncbi:hypothetical protein KEM56_006720 [Ascosphaera pollenicola]|nr:hypothetical protein KEM56_006720 [Ascosphaera pollenicola]
MAYSLFPSTASRKRIFDAAVNDLPSPKRCSTRSVRPDQSPDAHHRQRTYKPPDTETATEGWDRAWHTATAFLTFPDKELRLKEDQGEPSKVSRRWLKRPPSQAVLDSIKYIRSNSPHGRRLATLADGNDLQLWFFNEVRRHFLVNFRPPLVTLLNHSKDGVLQKVIAYLLLAQHIYLTVFSKYVLNDSSGIAGLQSSSGLISELHSLFSHALPTRSLFQHLKKEIQCLFMSMLCEITEDGIAISKLIQRDYLALESPGQPLPLTSFDNQRSALSNLETMLLNLRSVGLVQSREQKMLAEALNDWITEVIEASCSMQSGPQDRTAEKIRLWSMNMLVPTVIKLNNILETVKEPSKSVSSAPRTELKLRDVAFARLGSLHVIHLFDIVAHQKYSTGPLDSLRLYATTPLTRFYLTSSFNAMLKRKLLQPGISTLKILQVYISMIRVFRQLDPRAVLLDRVARPVRRFLRERDDTAKIIVSGLMADPTDAKDCQHDSNTESEVLEEISSELAKIQSEGPALYKGELDLDDVSWMPDPIDAAPDYRNSGCPDIIGSLISLFENKETFVIELQRILGDRLLQNSGSHLKVNSLLQILRARFGDTALQACEVMLRDIIDSRTLDIAIHTPRTDIANTVPDNFHSRMLSYMYWPRLPNRAFKVPATIQMAQENYAQNFEALKMSRKLTWVQHLGRAVVELEFEDRVYRGEVTTWQASVIYSFQSSAADNMSATKSVGDIAKDLGMSPSLVRNACVFWVAKCVLKEVHHDAFQVLETLDDGSCSVEGTGSGNLNNNMIKTEEAVTAEADAEAEAEAVTSKMDLYWKFIVGMLTNQGSMPLNQIIMMLKIVVPGGFPFSNDELRDFLGKMVSQGNLEIGRGGTYRLVAK